MDLAEFLVSWNLCLDLKSCRHSGNTCSQMNCILSDCCMKIERNLLICLVVCCCFLVFFFREEKKSRFLKVKSLFKGTCTVVPREQLYHVMDGISDKNWETLPLQSRYNLMLGACACIQRLSFTCHLRQIRALICLPSPRHMPQLWNYYCWGQVNFPHTIFSGG